MKIWSTPSSAPAVIRCSAPPGMISSAGWNSSRTRPRRRPWACTSASARAAPIRAVVCTSCPQACATPGTVLSHGSPVVSCTGSASRSARSATSGPSSPSSARRPESPVRVTDQPASRTCAAATPEVRRSVHESSGCAWRSRRISIRSSACLSTTASTTRVASVEGSGRVGMDIGTRLVQRPGRDSSGASYAARRRSAATLAGRSPGEHRGPHLVPDGAHARRPAQPLGELVADQRPGEVQLLLGPLGGQAVGAQVVAVARGRVPRPRARRSRSAPSR